ncbi:polysaccharide biosynthesis/export family protein [Neisseria canis]|uniref:Capsule polysaccharide export outer membrane protein n=1 Tax=Neisseria canis TaxID=493 RepID=A0A1X3CPE2_9NEIS|nr:polysaccharide biosynthesis/export family protein [Neisseria canis]OSI09500.1 sugar ABC transporter substrate-binding protein [Neisseria canis]VEF00296.1 capsule polysaccharide export outer membrane protein [Neisseria canis]
MKKPLILVMIILGLSACGSIPSSGPSGRKISQLERQQTNVNVPKVELIEVNDTVVRNLYQQQLRQSFLSLESNQASPNAVGIGDVLDITIWEAAPAVLFGGSLSVAGTGTAQATKLPEQMVNQKGMISIPFVGNIHVAGKTPLQIQEQIKKSLHRKANQPQVMVRLAHNNAANVSVIRAGNSIRMPLTAAGERILDAIAAVGGSTANVQDTNIQLTRDDQVKTVALEDLVSNPRQNILLRRNDIVTMITTPYSFTSMGAVGHSQQINFSVKGLSLAEAIGRMGGLQDNRSDARGVFVFRYQPLADLPDEEKGNWLAEGYAYDAEIPVVYRLNLSDANSFFWMQRFPVQNKDVVYVSNAPLKEVQKFLQFVFSPVVSGVNSIDNIAN